MATAQILSNVTNTVVDTPQTLFTAGSRGVVIESFTAANNSAVNASYKAFIVSTDTEQPQRPFKIVVWGEIDLGIGVVNQVIPPGAELKLETSALDSIYFTATGREV
ncbi:MAG TPA: hypothetical protein EYN54_04710 [Methylococcaceae bacterium]|nr:hypothetical protein [Methylococcaceae bacterium]